jgi:hypothetical protein
MMDFYHFFNIKVIEINNQWNRIYLSDQITFSQVQDRYYEWNGSEAFYNINYIMLSGNDHAAHKQQFIDAAGSNIGFAPSAGSIHDTGSIADHINERKTKYSGFEDKLRNGQITKADADRFVKDQENTAASILKVLQEQLDGWAENHNGN